MKNFFLKSLAIGVVAIWTVAGIYALSVPGTSSGPLWSLRAWQNANQLKAENWEALLTYVENLKDTVDTLSGKLATLKEGTGMETQQDQIPLGTIIAVRGYAASKTEMNAKGWALCDGSAISSQVVDADMGGATPNLAGRTLVGAGTIDSATFSLGAESYTYNFIPQVGEVRHELSIAEMPSHFHYVVGAYEEGWWISENRNYAISDFNNNTAGTNEYMYHLRAVNTSSSTANAGKSSNVGSGALSNNMPPFYVVEYYIKVKNQNTTTSVSDTYYRYEGSYGGCSWVGTICQKTRTVQCRRSSDGTQVEDSFCPSPKPDTSTSEDCVWACGNGGWGGWGCFIAGTQILMADGSLKAIETITTGDQLMGAHSINTVLIPLKIKWANRPLYAINDSAYFVTESHPFMTTQGWKAIDVVAAKKENPDLEITPLVVGDVLITVDNGQQLVERISIQTLPWTSFVYNFMIDGDNTYYANGYLVHNKQDAEEYYQ